MFILIPYTLINWVFYPYRSYKYKKFSKIINDCDASLLETIKLIVIYAELISTIILAILNSIATIIVIYLIIYHLAYHNGIWILLFDLITFLLNVWNARLFIDFANNNTLYLFSRIESKSKSIQDYLHRHNDQCRLLQKVNETWSFGNFFAIVFNLPVNIILINIIIHYELSDVEKFLFLAVIASHSAVMFNLIESLHPIHKNAHASRKLIQTIFAKSFKSPPSIQLLRLRIKLLNYLERLGSRQKQIGVSIGPGKPITHWKLWKLLLLYAAYFINAYSVFYSKKFDLFD
ncbi:hypothetical protein QR98_0100290 [Sarcoptes scabiei]|uniref:Uncharacterized protein n=1 Tax=Sarcoptes scabiei TaxID=52283 RepID=A0A132AKU4_SARSC|nr:hypothetical protein QR98_0100290 [Sarcoptes scabiei]